MKFLRLVATMLLSLSPTAGFAQTFTTTGNTAVNGNYGVPSAPFSAAGSSLKMIASAWQINQSSGAITSAYLGAYGGGFGVTGVNDQKGANDLHQIDNLGSYTDLVMFQFNRSVTLSGLSENLYQLSGVTGTHGDFAVANAFALTPSVWNATINLATSTASSFTWKEVTGTSGSGATSGSTSFSTSGGSRVWLLSASQLSSGLNDGFKLASITVTETPAVPEPATWAMLIVGFGAIGMLQRRRVRPTTPVAA